MKTHPVYLKFTNSDEIHNGFTFRTGMNTDTNPFDPDPENECGPYGLYFTDVKHGVQWIDTSSAYVREVTITEGEPIVTLADKSRAHRIILGPRRNLSKVAAWKWMVSKGVNVTAYENQALRIASGYGRLNVVKYLVSKGADVTAWNNDALCWASLNGHMDVIKYLIKQGADVTGRAIDWASINGMTDAMEYLKSVRAGGSPCH